jgi:alpha-beta hydrolase superfamily lysophospholipase
MALFSVRRVHAGSVPRCKIEQHTHVTIGRNREAAETGEKSGERSRRTLMRSTGDPSYTDGHRTPKETSMSATLTLLSMLIAQVAGASGAAPAQPFSTEQVEMPTATGTIRGALVVPPASDKVPIVLIVAGSGPTDRNGNSALLPGKNNAYKMLAESLAAAGIASLRYDKRGLGASAKAAGAGESSLRFDTYVDDAASWVAQLRTDKRFSRVIVAGHSEGSLIGMLAARKAQADGFVSIAGVAHRASEVLRDQLRPQIGALPALWDGNETILASLERGVVVDALPPAVQAVPAIAQLYRPSVQPYLISWFKFVPSSEIAALSVPVLILQGTTDIQVSVDEAKGLKAARPDAELILVDGMNHVMKHAPADRMQNVATYSNPDLQIVPDVPNAIVAFVRRVGHS